MLTLSADPYNLVKGQLIIAKISAFNVIGYSDPSTPNSEGVVVQVAPPTAPADLVVNLNETNE